MLPRCSRSGCDRVVYVDKQSGWVHDYCGRTCAQLGQGRELGPPTGPCATCNLPGCDATVWFDQDTGRVHDFCSKAHANTAIARGLWDPSNRGRQGHRNPAAHCSLPGCTAARFVDETTGRRHDYCGKTHALKAKEQGLRPLSDGLLGADNGYSKVWSGRQGEPDYAISLMSNASVNYSNVKRQFWEGWVHPGSKPTVMRVYEIKNPTPVYQSYKNYIAELERDGTDVAASKKRRFHGTSMDPKCRFGIDQTQPPCTSESCAVCCIAARGFDLSLSKRGPGAQAWGGGLRYGSGHYFSKASSKSNDYAYASERQGKATGGSAPDGTSAVAQFRCVFMCTVILGTSLNATQSHLSEDQLKPVLKPRLLDGAYGLHDSVTGLTTDDGGALNYEENVVYDDCCAIPSYLIVYRMP